MDNEFLSTKRYFAGRDITLSDEWLESCIDWCHGENPGSNCSLATLHLKVYEQWLLLDLRDVEKSTLPANLSQHKKYILNGNFSLQILQIVDTSRPKLLQLQKIRNSSIYNHTTAEKEWGPVDGKRVLLLLLSDGVTEVEAIEYTPIKSLNVNLPPGTKIKIVGPTTIRRGQMFLEEKNVEVLGGEIEDLLVCNAAENVLARALNLPENPNPIVVEDNFIENEREGPVTQRSNGIEQFLVPTTPRESKNARAIIITDDEERRVVPEIKRNQARSTSLSISVPKSRQPTSNQMINSISEEEEMRIASEIEMMMEIENDIREESRANASRVTPSTCMPSRLNLKQLRKTVSVTSIPNKEERRLASEIDLTTEVKRDLMQGNKESGINYTNQTKTSLPNRSNTKSTFEDENIFEDMDIDAHLDMIDAQIMKNSQVISIANLKSKGACNGTFTIKAKFKTVKQKLTIANDRWFLKLQIEDESGDLEAYVHTDVITKLIGHSPSSILALKDDILKKNEETTAVVMKTVEDLKATIMKLDCLMEITFTTTENYPSITALK